jgi:Tfp pilus assembly protein PilF
MKNSNFLTILVSLFLIIAATAIVYSNSLNGPFLFDDYHNIIGNKHMQVTDLSFESLKKAAVEDPSKYRWAPKVSFALNYYFADKQTTGYHSDTPLAGASSTEPDVWGYHLLNLLVHIAAALSLYFLFRVTIGIHFPKDNFRFGNEVVLLAALIWAVHPVQTNGVSYVVQRMTSMAALFFISSLLFYVLGRRWRNGLTGKSIYFLLSFLCGFLAIFSKENGAILPFMILGYEYYFLGGLQLTFRNKKNLIILAGAALMVIAIGWIYLGGNPFARMLGGYEVRDFTMSERLLTQPRVLMQYLSLLVLPLPSRLNLAYDFPVSTFVFTPPATFFAILGVAALVLFMFFIFKRNRLLSFALFWFLANLAIESSFIPLEIIFEHRMYLPSAFLLLTLVTGLYRLLSFRHVKVARAGLLFIVVSLMVFTWQRNETWSSRENVWADVAQKAPNLTRGHLGLFVAYKAQNRNAEALESIKKAVEVGPGEFRPSYNLANYYFEHKQYKEALLVLNGMLKKKNLGTPQVYQLRGAVYKELKNYEMAISNARKALAVDPEHVDAFLLLGESYFRLSKFEQALKYYEKAREILPDTAGVYFNLGTVYYNLGKYDRAIVNYRRSLDLRPGNADAHYNLGMIYGAKGMSCKVR